MVRLKAFQPRLLSDAGQRFQFLMVRLKDSIDIHRSNYYSISIPYGSIKSKCELGGMKFTILFQFLMVRLKDESDKQHPP